jgi:hypothetical protein
MFNPRNMLLRWMMILLPVLILPGLAGQVHGQEGIVVENPNVSAAFGQSITFSATIRAALPIQQVSLVFRGVNEKTTRVETLQVAEDGSVSFVYDASLNAFPPFSWVVFWFQTTLEGGATYTSDPMQFEYRDDRFPWRQVSRENITVNWYAGDEAFGASALDTAAAGLLGMNNLIPISLAEPVQIYIYSNPSDLRDTLLLGGMEWAGGHAHPELGVVMVSVAPGAGQFMEMETMIPHELAHVMMYRALGDNYNSQPVWLLEGIASMVELYPSPEYSRALESASQTNSLIPFSELCASFPLDSGSAFLAYAQSQSFVTYIRNSFGTSGLARLSGAYSEGFDCELGATQALGIPLSQLDLRWRESVLGQNVAGVAFRNLLPFLLLLLVVLIVPLWGAIDMLRQRRKHAAKSQ